MVRVNNGDGETKETAIKILEAKDQREGRVFIENLLKKTCSGYFSGEGISTIDENGYYQEFEVYRRGPIEIWIDSTILFHVLDK
jgi:hypothetical protein